MNKILKRAMDRQKELLTIAREESRSLTDVEQREFDTLQSVIDGFNETPTDGNGDTGERGGNPPEGGSEPEGTPTPEGGSEPEERGGFTAAAAAEILGMCRAFGLEPDSYIKRGLTVDAARREIMDEAMRRNTPLSGSITITDDEADKFRRAVTDGILLRSGAAIEKPAEGSNNFRALSIREIAIECMERSGEKGDFRHMTPDKLYTECARSFYNPESAFPAILDDVVQKSYVEGLNKAKSTFAQWCKLGNLPNFKKTTNHEYIMSLGGELKKVPENGELTAYVPRDVAMPERQLDTYGTQFTMSRKAFIDDDIGLLTTMPRRYAEMSERTQNNLVYGILVNNKKIYDNKVLFSADRKNTLTTGTTVSYEAIEKMIYMIGTQKDEAGNQLALIPDLFIVPFGMGAKLEQVLYSPTIHTIDNTQAINPYARRTFKVVEDVTLNTLAAPGEAIPWFMGVSGEIMQVDYLNGQRAATIRRSERPGTLGFVWDVYHDFGVSMLHPQCICRNPGVKITV